MGFREIQYLYTVSELGDQAFRPLRGAAGRLSSLAEPAVVSLSARRRPPTIRYVGWRAGSVNLGL